MDIFEELHTKRIINAAGTYTFLGGSKMSEKTIADMKEISSSFVQLRELQENINLELAKLTHNEGAYVCTGAAAGIYLSVAAAVAKKRKKKFYYMTNEEIANAEVLVFKAHRNPYDLGIKQLGVKTVEIGFANTMLPSTEEDVRNAINENTVAIYYLASGWSAVGAISLERIYSVTKELDIPIIVDAAAQLPPVENLWSFIEKGAAVTIFSGGKDIKGPQSSGLIVGKKEMIDELKTVGFPNYGIGRMLKVGREEMVGLYSAVKQYVNMDHQKRYDDSETQIQLLKDQLKDSDIFLVDRTYPNEAGQPIARAFVSIIGEKQLGEELHEFLLQGDDAIYAATEDLNGVYVNPMSLNQDEILIIAQKLKKFEALYLKK
ncbi:MAG: hypothetical protein ACYDG2_06930 [Ruminiclostridium sp.]